MEILPWVLVIVVLAYVAWRAIVSGMNEPLDLTDHYRDSLTEQDRTEINDTFDYYQSHR